MLALIKLLQYCFHCICNIRLKNLKGIIHNLFYKLILFNNN